MSPLFGEAIESVAPEVPLDFSTTLGSGACPCCRTGTLGADVVYTGRNIPVSDRSRPYFQIVKIYLREIGRSFPIPRPFLETIRHQSHRPAPRARFSHHVSRRVHRDHVQGNHLWLSAHKTNFLGASCDRVYRGGGRTNNKEDVPRFNAAGRQC